jgi:hypothetical protein
VEERAVEKSWRRIGGASTPARHYSRRSKTWVYPRKRIELANFECMLLFPVRLSSIRLD